MNKKITLGLTISLVAIAAAVTFILTSLFSLRSFNEKLVDFNEKAEKYEKLEALDTLVREEYFGEIDEEELSDGILKGYMSGTGDEYSRYLNAEEYQDELAEDTGKRVGLGITVTEDESGYILINEILDGSPLKNSDIKVGDIIVSVDDTDVLRDGYDKAVNALKGAEGTDVTIIVRRDGIDRKRTFKRVAVEIVTVSGEMLDGYIGLIKISGFKKNTSEQFIAELEKLSSNGAKGFIFDLRDNAGGLVSTLEKCIDPLLPEGTVATAVYKDGHEDTLVYSDESELNIPMVVLVNAKTASVAELFTASLKDFGKVKVVGQRTFGKGVMQETIPLENGGAAVITVAEFRTAVSGSFNNVGITPDYIVENEIPDIDIQLDKAVEVLNEE